MEWQVIRDGRLWLIPDHAELPRWGRNKNSSALSQQSQGTFCNTTTPDTTVLITCSRSGHCRPWTGVGERRVAYESWLCPWTGEVTSLLWVSVFLPVKGSGYTSRPPCPLPGLMPQNSPWKRFLHFSRGKTNKTHSWGNKAQTRRLREMTAPGKMTSQEQKLVEAAHAHHLPLPLSVLAYERRGGLKDCWCICQLGWSKISSGQGGAAGSRGLRETNGNQLAEVFLLEP